MTADLPAGGLAAFAHGLAAFALSLGGCADNDASGGAKLGAICTTHEQCRGDMVCGATGRCEAPPRTDGGGGGGGATEGEGEVDGGGGGAGGGGSAGEGEGEGGAEGEGGDEGGQAEMSPTCRGFCQAALVERCFDGLDVACAMWCGRHECGETFQLAAQCVQAAPVESCDANAVSACAAQAGAAGECAEGGATEGEGEGGGGGDGEGGGDGQGGGEGEGQGEAGSAPGW